MSEAVHIIILTYGNWKVPGGKNWSTLFLDANPVRIYEIGRVGGVWVVCTLTVTGLLFIRLLLRMLCEAV